ncbi:MAG: regulatory iron-sulfur-containing complex subunit RicT [Bacilli bacterium]
MNYYIYVRFNEGGKGYTFSTNIDNLKEGDLVVVETIKGLEIGTVCSDLFSMDLYKSDLELKPILREAGQNDLQTLKDNRERAIKASVVFTTEAEKLKLDMKLVDCEYTLDVSKVIFSYLADDRIDFRELLKRLASLLHCRIELKQIGARDKAKIVGGIGICGLQLCCNLFLNEFNGISINKAKNQMLAINIPKISGQCGKLMCCLKFEDDLYTEEKQKFPEMGTKIRYENKDYYTSSFNILSKNIKLDSGDGVAIYLSLDQVKAAIEKEKQPKPKEPVTKDQNQYRRRQK